MRFEKESCCVLRLVLNSLCSTSWPWIHGDPPTSASQLLGLLACTTTFGSYRYYIIQAFNLLIFITKKKCIWSPQDLFMNVQNSSICHDSKLETNINSWEKIPNISQQHKGNELICATRMISKMIMQKKRRQIKKENTLYHSIYIKFKLHSVTKSRSVNAWC